MKINNSICKNMPPTRYRYVSIEEFNNILVELKKHIKEGFIKTEDPCFKCPIMYYINDLPSSTSLIMYENGHRTKYTCWKDNNIKIHIAPQISWIRLHKCCPELKKYNLKGQYNYVKSNTTGKVYWGNLPSVAGMTYLQNKYKDKELKHCYEYDINSSYAYAMKQDMPDTTKEPRIFSKLISDDEIGFRFDDQKPVVLYTDLGGKDVYCDFVFKKVKSPLIPFVDKYYALKKSASSEEKKKYKEILVQCSGMMQRYNIFFRNAIVDFANRRIKQYQDENTVYMNTDSIVSLTKRNDLPISDNLGDFKEEVKDDTFRYKAHGNYSWKNADINKHQGKVVINYEFNLSKLIMEPINYEKI